MKETNLKLTDLNPKWLGSGGDGVFDKDGNPAPERFGVAIIFDCPCRKPNSRCVIEIRNPLDEKPGLRDDKHSWHREGTTFEDLSLTPSIQRLNCCRWHGYITKGKIFTC